MQNKPKIKSIRLNKEIRVRILNNIMDSFDKENPTPPEVRNTQKLLNTAVYTHYLEKHKATLDELEKVSKKYKGAVARTAAMCYIDELENVCSVNFSTMNSDNKLNGVYIYPDNPLYVTHPDFLEGMFINLKDMREIPEVISEALKDIKKEKKNDKAIKKALNTHNVERLEYRETVKDVIDGVNTTGQLLEVWEEVEQFLPQGISNPSGINLPTINIKSLNSKIGL